MQFRDARFKFQGLLVRQVIDTHHMRARLASADEPTLRGRDWIEQQWEAARIEASESGKSGSVLVPDEIKAARSRHRY